MFGSVLAYGLAVVVAAGLWAGRRYPARALDAWAVAHGLEITATNRPLVTWYLRTGRQLRTIGVISGLTLPPLLAQAFTGSPSILGGLGYVGLLTGHLAGSLYAELSLSRPVGPRASASLVPRELADYLPLRLRNGQRVVAVMAVATGIAAAILPDESAVLFFGPPRSTGEVALLTAATVAVIMVVEWLERLVVCRPQPVATPDLLAADDAIRASSVHSICGAGLAIALLLTGRLLGDVAGASDGVLGSAAAALGAIAWLGAYIAFLYYGNRAWRVARSRRALAPEVAS